MIEKLLIIVSILLIGVSSVLVYFLVTEDTIVVDTPRQSTISEQEDVVLETAQISETQDDVPNESNRVNESLYDVQEQNDRSREPIIIRDSPRREDREPRIEEENDTPKIDTDTDDDESTQEMTFSDFFQNQSGGSQVQNPPTPTTQ
ncbi:MAG: hypothetical protein ACMXYA_01760 [Candidatus Woesearchaeota archaeon]